MSEEQKKKPEENHSMDILDMLKQNNEIAQKHEKPLEVKPRESRKKFDYWVVMISVNSLLILIMILGWDNLILRVYLASGIVIFSSAFTWIMWSVLSHY